LSQALKTYSRRAPFYIASRYRKLEFHFSGKGVYQDLVSDV